MLEQTLPQVQTLHGCYLKVTLHAAVGKGPEGSTENGGALLDSQAHMNGATGSAPQLDAGIMDLCSSPDTSPAPKVGAVAYICSNGEAFGPL